MKECNVTSGTSMHYLWVLFIGMKNMRKVFTNHLNVFLQDPPAVEQVPKITVEEDGHVTKECNVTDGTPPPTVFWKIVNTNEVIYGKLLNITNITRNQSGEYKCFANNTCGSDSSTMFINVQCKNQHITSSFIVCSNLVAFAVRCFSVWYMYLFSVTAVSIFFLLY